MSITVEGACVDVVDDDASIRRSLARMLKLAGYQVRAFPSAEEFRQAGPPPGQPACLLLDLRLPERGGLELQQELLTAREPIPIVFLTGRGDIPSSVRAMKDGAVDFLLKPVARQELLTAIRAAHERGRRELQARQELSELEERLGTLTRREREVMQWVVRGAPNKQIAGRLGTVEKTVKVHRARVMQKMGVSSVADLVRAAEKLDLPAPAAPGSPRGLD
jgi:FixJ family two-component response regulator